MSPLERRQRGREPQPAAAAASEAPPLRRREDQISLTLFELAKEEAAKKGYEAGYQKGWTAGYADGETRLRAEQEQRLADELAARLAPVGEIVAQLNSAADALGERVARQLAELAIEAGRQLAGRALELKPEHILDDIEELLERHTSLSGSPTLFVSVDDMPLVEHHLGQHLATAGWRLRADVGLASGDCRIEDDEREIDSTAADRWERLLQAVGHEEH